ncbi:MAG: glutaminyl-peptide cyclotransferase [Bacteroidales bacterium]|nr:glutaminyl-peptide cyclotransferase [Bacteroidales bacterium]
MKRFVLSVAASLLCLAACSAPAPRQYSVKVVREYPHDVHAYTQGLFFEDGQLYESTGQTGRSSFRKVDLQTGKVLRKLDFNRKYFGEGSVIFDGKVYMLTWTSKVAFVYDASTLEYIKSYSYPREGWGLTTDGKNLIASDGSSALYFLDGEFRLQKSVKVTLNGKPVRYLNELEWVDGRIWANIYTTDTIVIINPSSGAVEGVVDCSGLLPQKLRTRDTDVLNGIAVLDGRIFLTGKNWPRLYEVELKEK